MYEYGNGNGHGNGHTALTVFTDPQTGGRTFNASNGEVVYQPATPAENFYFIRRGQVRLYTVGVDEDSTRLIEILGPGNWFGAAALAGHKQYGMRAIVVGTGAVITEIRIERLLAALSNHPNQLMELTRQLAGHLLRSHAEASRLVGGPQIQNRGTIGGNIANASPAGDSLPVLAAVDATVVLRSAAGERRVAFNGFYTGYRESVRRADELIVAVEVPAVSGRQWFRKVGTRAAQAISKVVIAGVRDDRTVRIALGSVAPTVVRARRTEEALGAGASIDEAVQLLRDEIVPIDDIRSTAGYRRLVSGNLVRRFLTDTQ